MNLFFITGYNSDDISLDLMVRAKTVIEAVDFWKAHFLEFLIEEEAQIVEEVNLTTEDYRVFEDHVLARVFDMSDSNVEGIIGAISWPEIPILALVKTH